MLGSTDASIKKHKVGAGGTDHMLESLPSKWEALSSNLMGSEQNKTKNNTET
jgi:hypothetical protein